MLLIQNLSHYRNLMSVDEEYGSNMEIAAIAKLLNLKYLILSEDLIVCYNWWWGEYTSIYNFWGDSEHYNVLLFENNNEILEHEVSSIWQSGYPKKLRKRKKQLPAYMN